MEPPPFIYENSCLLVVSGGGRGVGLWTGIHTPSPLPASKIKQRQTFSPTWPLYWPRETNSQTPLSVTITEPGPPIPFELALTSHMTWDLLLISLYLYVLHVENGDASVVIGTSGTDRVTAFSPVPGR